MEWIEVKIKTTSEAVELITGLLMANNIPNVRIINDAEVDRFLLDHPLNWDYKCELPTTQTEDAEVIFYVQEDAVGREILARIEMHLQALTQNIPEINFGALSVLSGPVNDDDWLHEWRKTYKPFTIGKNVVVRPYWEEYTPKIGETVFTIDPGAVFGTGLHGTTQLCVMALENLKTLEGSTVLDIGCGSGILSVIALLLGASSATACDIDPGAARCALENARLNQIDQHRFEVFTGDIFEDGFLQDKKYDIILANIVADVIIGLGPIIPKFMKKEGLFIASGIIDERIAEVREAIENSGLQIIEENVLDGWHCIVAGLRYA